MPCELYGVDKLEGIDTYRHLNDYSTSCVDACHGLEARCGCQLPARGTNNFNLNKKYKRHFARSGASVAVLLLLKRGKHDCELLWAFMEASSACAPSRLENREFFWRDRYSFFKRNGYTLRPRYHPNWQPSWKPGVDRFPDRCEDSIIQWVCRFTIRNDPLLTRGDSEKQPSRCHTGRGGWEGRVHQTSGL